MITDWQRFSLSLGQNAGAAIQRTATETVLINTDDGILTRAQILNHPNCPALWQPHPLDPETYAFDFDFSDDPLTSIKTVTFKYSNTFDATQTKLPSGPYKIEPDPTLRPAHIETDTWANTEEVQVDMDGNKVETTAGERILMTETFHYPRFIVSKNLKKPFSIQELALKADPPPRAGVVSNGMFSIDFLNIDKVTVKGIEYAPMTLWATNFKESGYQIEGKYVFYTLRFELRHNPNKWDRYVLNAGFMEKSRIVTYRSKGEIAGLPSPIELENGVEGRPPAGYYEAYVRFGPLKRITIGVDNAFPREPVPIDANGRAYRDERGFVISPETGGGSGYAPLMKKFRLFRKLDFGKNLPKMS